MLIIITLFSAYLLGSLSGSLLLGRFQGVDIRQSGSGNAGGTNALRTRGWRFALGVVAIDVGKGAAAAHLPRLLPLAPETREALQLLCVLLAVVGHTWPLYFGFRGGKGAATLVGGLIIVWPWALPWVLAVWMVLVFSTGYVGLATIIAAACVVPLAFADPGQWPAMRLAFAVSAALFIAFTHRSNVRRLCSGTEARFERLRLFKRLFDRR